MQLLSVKSSLVKIKQVQASATQLAEVKYKLALSKMPPEQRCSSHDVQLAEVVCKARILEKERLEAVVDDMKVKSRLHEARGDEQDELINKGVADHCRRWERLPGQQGHSTPKHAPRTE